MTTTQVMTIDTIENVQAVGASREAVLREQLRRALAGQTRLEELLKHGRSHLMELRKQVENAVAERDRATRELAELQSEHQRLSDERAEAESSLTAFLEQDVQRLQEKLQAVTAHRDDVTAQLHARVKEMQVKDEASEQRAQELRVKLDHLAGENAALKDKEAELERRVTAIEAKSEQLDQALANRNVKLSAVEQTIQELEPLARLGRAAREVAKELRSTTQSMDAHADHLLGVTPVASDCREEIERLRAEAVRAHSLARQFVEDN
jgi:chromosome segregation ATPase